MDDNKRNGPEFAPTRLKFDEKPLIVLIDIVDRNDNVIRSERIDFSNKDDRNWLGRLSYWAWTNGHSVETSADKD